MKPSEAIKELETEYLKYPLAHRELLVSAVKLGREALKRVLRAHNPANPPEPLLLPGEDPE